MWQIWLIIAGVCLVLEMMTHGFLVFWFALGSVFAMISSLFIDNIVVQTAIFILSSTILIFATKPLVKKFINKTEDVLTNAYSVIGKTAIVTESINSKEGVGLVKLDGEVWSAVGLNDADIQKGSEVKIIEIKGVKLIVTKINVTSNY